MYAGEGKASSSCGRVPSRHSVVLSSTMLLTAEAPSAQPVRTDIAASMAASVSVSADCSRSASHSFRLARAVHHAIVITCKTSRHPQIHGGSATQSAFHPHSTAGCPQTSGGYGSIVSPLLRTG